MRRKRWAVLISGRGSNLSAILDLAGVIEIALVVSSKAQAAGLARAKRLGVRTHLFRKSDSWDDLTHFLRRSGIDYIFLAGFMRILPVSFVEQWQNRILNVHPSLLPSYAGLESIQRAHHDQQDVGVTIHQVNEAVDAGAIVSQRLVVSAEQTKTYSLAKVTFLVHLSEHRLVREAVLRWKNAMM